MLDNFPTSYVQAKLLEKALSGFDSMSREGSNQNLAAAKGVKGKMKKSQLAPDPRPQPPPPEPPSGIDVVILFDLPDDLCLKRSAGRTCKYDTHIFKLIFLQLNQAYNIIGGLVLNILMF